MASSNQQVYTDNSRGAIAGNQLFANMEYEGNREVLDTMADRRKDKCLIKIENNPDIHRKKSPNRFDSQGPYLLIPPVNQDRQEYQRRK